MLKHVAGWIYRTDETVDDLGWIELAFYVDRIDFGDGSKWLGSKRLWIETIVNPVAFFHNAFFANQKKMTCRQQWKLMFSSKGL